MGFRPCGLGAARGCGRCARRRDAGDRLGAVRRGLPRHRVRDVRRPARLRLTERAHDRDRARPRPGERLRAPNRQRLRQPGRAGWIRRRARALRVRPGAARQPGRTLRRRRLRPARRRRLGSDPLLRQRGRPRRVPERGSGLPVPGRPVPDVLRPLRVARREVPLARREDRAPHEHGRRRARPRPAPQRRRRSQAHVPRLLVRQLPRQHVRQPLPEQRPRARHRRRARPAPVVERLADQVRPRRHAGGVRRVPAPLPRGRPGVRVR